ncbi:YiiD C-terminal domain-containing protein [Aliikangiella maris]|uniref:YiiD C-terminal domain-containing protein n=2 Tax=Aliikangiella maris TaxID=3162458 RepID=A0ABV3MT50_9GAMM
MKNKYEKLVHETIPVSKAIGWQISLLDSLSIKTITQLSPNINIHGTVFAGSIYAAGMATGWTLLKCWYDKQGYQAELVAAEGNIKYFEPITQDFVSSANINIHAEQFVKLVDRLKTNKSCGFKQEVEITCKEVICAIMTIQFVFKCT